MSKSILLTTFTLTATLFLAACERTEDVGGGANVAQTTGQPAPQSAPTTTPPTVFPAQTNAAATPPPWLTPPPSPAQQPTPPLAPPAEARRISVEEARAAFERGQAVFVDVRLEEQYKQGHLPGAVSVPLEEVMKRSGRLPRNKLIITYCA